MLESGIGLIFTTAQVTPAASAMVHAMKIAKPIKPRTFATKT